MHFCRTKALETHLNDALLQDLFAPFRIACKNFVLNFALNSIRTNPAGALRKHTTVPQLID
jgi:hypothetical protein